MSETETMLRLTVARSVAARFDCVVSEAQISGGWLATMESASHSGRHGGFLIRCEGSTRAKALSDLITVARQHDA